MKKVKSAAGARIPEPVRRGRLRRKFGGLYYGCLRKAMWITMRKRFAGERGEPLTYCCFSHETPLLRQLDGLNMVYQYNKVTNLKLASKKIDQVIIHPGEVFSYWRLIGKPTRRKGYLDGMVLQSGQISAGVGGGLCQLSNLIFWMALHSPLTVVERHRHGYDVFPDANRKQPFGSGATCSYPHIDLMLRNDTDMDFQFLIWMDEGYLKGELRSSAPIRQSYRIIEKNHLMQREFWGGYSRSNELYREIWQGGEMLCEEFLLANQAIMMYAPFIEEKIDEGR